VIHIAVINAKPETQCDLCGAAGGNKEGKILEVIHEEKLEDSVLLRALFFCGACFSEVLHRANTTIWIETVLRDARTIGEAPGLH
jgi:hypothetical protein